MTEKTILRKETSIGRYLSYNSYCPISYKRYLVKILLNRVRKLCSTYKIQEEMAYTKECLIKNGYSKKFIMEYEKRLQKVLNKQ